MGESGSNPNPDEDRPSDLLSESEAQASPYNILIVEDNTADVFLIRSAIKTADIKANLHLARDGEQAVRFFEQVDSDPAAPCLTLVILDINLPRKHGGEVLQQMRASRRCAKALVIAVSTSSSDQDRESMTNLGANEYFHKPSEYTEFMKLGEVIKALLERAS